MFLQVGKGPHANEVTGIVKIGQTMTMVLGVKDDENKFDMMVRNCVAHDGQRSPIQLVDEKGCVARPKIMSPFKKLKNFDATANVLSYAYFQVRLKSDANPSDNNPYDDESPLMYVGRRRVNPIEPSPTCCESRAFAAKG